MERRSGTIVVNGMTRRGDRPGAACAPGYVGIDERSLADLLDFAPRVAALVTYHGLDDAPDGDFGAFFRDDPVMTLATLAATPEDAIAEVLAELVERTRRARGAIHKHELLGQLFAAIVETARRLDQSLAALSNVPFGSAADGVRAAMAASVEATLGPALRRLEGYGAGATRVGGPIAVDGAGFLPVWELGPAPSDESVFQGRTPARRIDHALPAISAIGKELLGALASFKALAAGALAAALTKGGHKPHLALYLAFAQLFIEARGALDDVSARFIDLYYGDVLREPPLGPTGDSVYLAFTLAKGPPGASALLPAGTRFSAGKDQDGKPIVFASEAPLRVGAAAIDGARKLSVERGPLLPGGPEVTLRVLETALRPGVAPFAPFGATAGPDAVPATLGFAIASPYLRLAGGHRTLRVWIRLDPAAVTTLRARLDPLATATGARAPDLLREVIAGAFTLSLSTAAGFAKVPAYEALVDEDVLDDPTFALEVVLPENAPAVAPTDTSEATLKAHLISRPIAHATPKGSKVSVNPLSMLTELTVDAMWLETEVTGLKDLHLTNAGGPISVAQPFPLFGGPPGVGAALDLFHPELFVDKRPSQLTVRLDWLELPPDDTGFAGYYNDWTVGLDGVTKPGLLDNRSFRASLAAIGPAAFELDDDAREVYLFRTDPSAEPLEPDALGKLAPATELGPFETCPLSRGAWGDGSRGALRLSLVGPPEAFGNIVYGQNVAAAIRWADPSRRTEADEARCQAGCATVMQPLTDAAELIGAALALCGAKGNLADCRHCFDSSLSMCREMLLSALADGLKQATEKAAPALGPDEAAPLLAAEKAAQTAAPDARETALGTWLDACVAALGDDPGIVAWTCKPLWDALGALDAAAGRGTQTSLDGFKSQMANDLGACRDALEAARAKGQAACVEACAHAAKQVPMPRPPWLPRAKAISADYQATCRLFGSPPEAADSEQSGTVLHLLPFGGETAWSGTGAPLLPAIEHPRGLLLGLTGVHPPEALTLLVQLAETGDASTSPWPAVTWEHLSGEAWAPLVPRTDGTDGLRRTGILMLELPTEGEPGGSTPGEPTWIRASVKDGADRFPAIVGLYPYSLIARWQDDGNTGAHLATPRPPGSIKGPLDQIPGLAETHQPMASFGGVPPETEATRPIRLGERIRHRERAVVGWDYERLVLERFPQIEGARTIPARTGTAGAVTVVVLPSPEVAEGSDPIAPKASGDLLAEIEESLTGLTSPFVALRVVNPTYVRITVTALIEVVPGEDPQAGKQQLSDDLVQALSPWATDRPWSGRYPTKDDLAELIRTRPYVNALFDLSLSYSPDPSTLDTCFLTSAPAHRILLEGEAVHG